ncbi:hypothetical protein BLL42_08005 [Pseudomonas frederiksbergensis]|uniref:Glycosyltransferase RgtA/B/C/D-like domain-containing protein n=1 Tax=Pseudomonas frederiksbergensis TaxID=104087 RepID=A0A1J0EIN4_9PSED|nr:hypothetical protein [Pseudomonas frederiksbergensis]APC15676.1 hypothetical protein BLL42_08005 [Pseudomonas frederiksbergensis]
MRNAVCKKILQLMPMVLICALLSGVFLPVYSDEIMTKFNNARFFLESGQMLSFFPQCTTTVGHGVAWVFYPAAILISSVYAYLEPLGLRVSGVVLALAWFGLLAYWCHRQAAGEGAKRFTFLVAFASLGVMPYLWVLSRPEQFMLLPVLIFCMLAVLTPAQGSGGRQLAVMGGLGLLLSVFFYAHPKSLFFTPFLLATVWIATRGFNLLIRAGLVLYVLALSVQVLRDASLLGGCQDAPAIQALLAANSLMPGMLLSDPVAFFGAVWQNISLFPQRMLVHLTFSPTFQSGWLPPLTEKPDLLLWLNPLIYNTLLVLVVGSHLLALGMAVISLARRRMSAALLLASLLAAGDLINVALYNLQNFYAGIQYVPLSIVIVALLFQCLPVVRPWFAVRVAGHLTLAFVAGLSLISLFTLFYLVTPNLLRNAEYANASIPGQPLSVPVLGAKAHLDSIRELGESCHIPADHAEHVVVDHMTYFAYLKDRSPVHVLYVSEFGYGGDLLNGKLLPFLKERNSPGLITRCEWVPNEFRDVQRQNDRGYCCVDFGVR